jgi:hypothetical protein
MSNPGTGLRAISQIVDAIGAEAIDSALGEDKNDVVSAD